MTNSSIAGKDAALRAALVIDDETMSRHCDLVVSLKSEFHHTIRCLARPADGTCVTYALDLLKNHQPLVKELQECDIRPGCDFMNWLFEDDCLREITTPQQGALVCYFRAGEWQHVGLALPEGRIRSKWGSYAVFNHKVSEVPKGYGDDLSFFIRPSAREAARLLFNYACIRMNLKPIEADRLRVATGIGELF